MINRSWNDFERNLNALLSTVAAAETIITEKKAENHIIVCNIICQSTRVALCGHFEGFIKNIANEYIDIINRRKICIDQIDEKILHCVLSSHTERYKSSSSLGYAKLIEAIKESKHHKIDIRKYLKTDSNPSVSTIESIFNNIGFESIIIEACITDFGINPVQFESHYDNSFDRLVQRELSQFLLDPHAGKAKLIEIIDMKWTPKKKLREVGYIHIIQELLKSRNSIAHGDESIETEVTPLDVKNDIENVKRIAIFITQKLNKSLETYQENVASA